MLRKSVAVLVLVVAATVGGLNCTKLHINFSTAAGLPYILWCFFGLTYGTDAQPYVASTVNGEVMLVPLADPQPTISPAGQFATASVVPPGSSTVVRTIYAPDLFTKGILVLSAPDLTQLAVIKPASQPEDVVLSPDQSTLYAALLPPAPGGSGASGTGSIAVISTATNTVSRTISLPSGAYPQFLAISPDGATLYAADNRATYGSTPGNDMLAIDTATGAVKASISVAPAFNSVLGRPVVSPDGLSIYQTDILGFEVIDATTLQPNYAISAYSVNAKAHSIFTPDGRILYAASYSSILVIEAATGKTTATIPLPAGSSANLGDLTITPDGGTLLAADLTAKSGQGALYQIDTATNSIAATILPPAGAPLMSNSMQVLALR